MNSNFNCDYNTFEYSVKYSRIQILTLGSCGSGGNGDCGPFQWHGIQCCDLGAFAYSECEEK